MPERIPHISPKGFRALPPVGGFPPLLDTFSAWRKLRQSASSLEERANPSESFRRSLQTHFAVESCELYGSGSEALYSIFCRIRAEGKRRVVIMASYTCPSIACAAARAGLRIQPVDINERSLEMELQEVASFDSISAIVVSNLYGMVDNLDRIREISHKHNVVIIDDACQSALSKDGEGFVGSRPGVIGVLSFGRGKAIGGVGGGAIIGTNNEFFSYSNENWIGEEIGWIPTTKKALMAAIAPQLEIPSLFWLPARLPFLGLGETHCAIDFALNPISEIEMAVGHAQLLRIEETRKVARENANMWEAHLGDIPVIQPYLERNKSGGSDNVLLRYPIIFESRETRDRIWTALVRAGLGASKSYPDTLRGYRELRDFLVEAEDGTAKKVSENIITLPVHRYVSERDMNLAAKLIRTFV